MSGTRWSDIRAAIEAAGGPVTPHPDAETLRLLAEHQPAKRLAAEYLVTRLEPPLNLDEDPPPPIPARPYTHVYNPSTMDDDGNERLPHNGYSFTETVPNPPSRRGWRRIFRRAA